jgi:hypothetical protein
LDIHFDSNSKERLYFLFGCVFVLFLVISPTVSVVGPVRSEIGETILRGYQSANGLSFGEDDVPTEAPDNYEKMPLEANPDDTNEGDNEDNDVDEQVECGKKNCDNPDDTSDETKNDEDQTKDESGSTEESGNNPDDSAESDTTAATTPAENIETVNKNSDFYEENDTTIKDINTKDMIVLIPDILGKEGSIWDCQMNGFNSGLTSQQIAEECGTIPDLLDMPASDDTAILGAAASQAGTGRYHQTTTTATSSPCGDDPRGNPYGEGDDGTQPADDDGTQPADDDGTQPADDDGTQPADDDGTQPADDDGTQPSGDGEDDVGKGKGKGKGKTEPKTEPAPKPAPTDTEDDLLEPLVPPVVLDSVDIHVYDPSKRNEGTGGGSGSSGSDGGPGQDSKRPVGGEDSSKADCVDFYNFVEQCKEINFKTPDCQKLVCDIDTTIALTTEEYTCAQSDVDPVKLKKIVFVACQETRKPLPGEDPCSPDKIKPMTAYTTQLNPCTNPVAMSNPDEPCPGSPDVMTILYLTTPQQPYPCPPDGTGVPKTCSGPPPGGNDPPGPIGPGPK